MICSGMEILYENAQLFNTLIETKNAVYMIHDRSGILRLRKKALRHAARDRRSTFSGRVTTEVMRNCNAVMTVPEDGEVLMSASRAYTFEQQPPKMKPNVGRKTRKMSDAVTEASDIGFDCCSCCLAVVFWAIEPFCKWPFELPSLVSRVLLFVAITRRRGLSQGT